MRKKHEKKHSIYEIVGSKNIKKTSIYKFKEVVKMVMEKIMFCRNSLRYSGKVKEILYRSDLHGSLS
jgi:hypothetical protein